MSFPGFAQETDLPVTGCAQQEINEQLFRARPDIRAKHLQLEQQLYEFRKQQTPVGDSSSFPVNRSASRESTLGTGPTVTLPVVVHIIHNNGTENISDARVFTAIQHLNEAFANTGYYDPANGASTGIQFCMAERDPGNNPTNGITRNVSPYTVMGGSTYYTDDQQVKNIVRWNPLCYINIYIVKSIPGSVAGYAYLPSAHGSSVDGIVMEAAYFGSSYPNDVVIIHEMGHFLGLYHTFDGGCGNSDCAADGDRVCDTPPDQSTAGVSCGSSVNSCSTDVLSGFTIDQPDLTEDYMDYGNFNCMKVFTQGQSDRMHWFIDNVRSSLLKCKSCMPPCPAPVTAAFSDPGSTVNAGSLYTFVNSSVNATSYEWRVNGVTVSSLTDLAYLFSPPGNYTITLIARSGNTLCDSAVKIITLKAICPVNAGFTSSATTTGAGTSINFINTTTGADSYEWFVNGVLQATTFNFSYTTTTAGTYIITLNAASSAANCNQAFLDTVYFTCPVMADFTPASITTIINTSQNFTSTSTGATGYEWKVNGVVAGTGSSLSYTFTPSGTYSILLTATNGVCSSVKTGVVYVGDKCGNPVYLFRKNYLASGSAIANNDILSTADGGSVNAVTITTPLVASGALMKLDASGELQWTKTYGSGTASSLLKVRATQDGGYIAIGSIAGAGGNSHLFIVKTAADGTLAWSRQLDLDGASFGINIIQSAEGDYYFTGRITSTGSANSGADAVIGKLTAAGTLVWMNNYDVRSTEVPAGLADEAGYIMVSGNLQAAGSSIGFLLRVNKASGAVNWSQNYTSGSVSFRQVLPVTGGYLVDGIRNTGIAGVITDHVYLFTDGAGNVTSSRYINPFGPAVSIGPTSLFLKSNGNIVSQTSSLPGGGYSDFLVQEIDPVAGILWSKTYNEPNTIINGIAGKPDNSFFLGGTNLSTPSPGYVMLVNPDGSGGSCPANPADIQLLTATYRNGPLDWSVKILQARFTLNHTAQDLPVTVTSQCQYVKCDDAIDTCLLCNTLQLNGADSICGKTGTYIYQANRKPGCTLPVKWVVDESLAEIILMTDSTIELKVISPGAFYLTGTIITPCDTLSDTIPVNTFDQPVTIDLGPDIDLCNLSTIYLNAGSGFATYTWQDNSADSFFTAYFPGVYSVNATDYCGNKYGDIITITQAPDLPFDLGPDTTVCLRDSLQLTATAGFTSYFWSPSSSAIDDPYSRTPVVYPDQETMYICTAEKYEGCTVTDSIRIKVNGKLPANFLDSSVNYCTGSSTEISAKEYYEKYTWSTGETSPSLTVTVPGSYWLMVIDSNGCSGSDTVLAVETDCLKGIHFPNAFTPNGDGRNDVFKAIVGVLPELYLLVVYNRWGEKVFETTNPVKGWNGIYKGKRQSQNGYTWYARFKFKNEKEQMAKGVVVLIR